MSAPPAAMRMHEAKPRDPCELTAIEAAERIRTGALTSVELAAACLDRITHRDAAPCGWAEVAGDRALELAREMDALRRHGLPLGALHGVPVALDERFGGQGRAADPGKTPPSIAHPPRGTVPAALERLREAGAVSAGRTRNVEPVPGAAGPVSLPQDGRRTAGASCGAAAAAVATGQVPLALTCEAHGGVMLAASYCGVFGFRPGRGLISRRGTVSLSPTLDQVGILARSLEDAALIADALGAYDAADTASYLRPRPRMFEGVRATPPVEPDFIRFDMPYDQRLSAAGREGFEELCAALGARVACFPAPAWFGRLPAAHRIVVEYETAAARPAQAAPSGAARAEHAPAPGEEKYRAALAAMEQAQRYFSELFRDYDAVIAPAAAGEAPSQRSPEADDQVFAAIGALCGLPALCVPLLEGESGLPVGVQVAGCAHRDDRLLRTARWLIEALRSEAPAPALAP